MTLDQLKAKATAAEICLIELVETLTVEKIKKEATDKVVRFIQDNPPPSREDVRFDPDLIKRWLIKLETKFHE